MKAELTAHLATWGPETGTLGPQGIPDSMLKEGGDFKMSKYERTVFLHLLALLEREDGDLSAAEIHALRRYARLQARKRTLREMRKLARPADRKKVDAAIQEISRGLRPRAIRANVAKGPYFPRVGPFWRRWY